MGDKIFKPINDTFDQLSGRSQRRDAGRAADTQAEYAEQARQDLQRAVGTPLESVQRQRLQGLGLLAPQQFSSNNFSPVQQNPVGSTVARNASQSSDPRFAGIRGLSMGGRVFDQDGMEVGSRSLPDVQRGSNIRSSGMQGGTNGGMQAYVDGQSMVDQAGAAVPELQLSRLESQNALQDGTGQMVDTLQRYGEGSQNALQQGTGQVVDTLTGAGLASAGFVNQGYDQANNRLNPIAGRAYGYQDEQAALMGLSGEQAYQDALSRAANPLQAEQERAFSRNQAMFGGVGGNALSALADQTRRQTEASIGQRLGLLGQASSPSLQALQQMTSNDISRGSNLANVTQSTGGNIANAQGNLGYGLSSLNQSVGTNIANAQGNLGSGLSALYQNSGNSMANAYIGQGTQLAQNSNDIGTARAGEYAFRAQQTPLYDAIGATTQVMGSMGGMPVPI